MTQHKINNALVIRDSSGLCIYIIPEKGSRVHGHHLYIVGYVLSWGCPGPESYGITKIRFYSCILSLRTYRANRMKIIAMRRMRFDSEIEVETCSTQYRKCKKRE